MSINFFMLLMFVMLEDRRRETEVCHARTKSKRISSCTLGRKSDVGCRVTDESTVIARTKDEAISVAVSRSGKSESSKLKAES
ncbi:hypothetical protein SYJ56_25025 [Algoriphagus sp. D3-2-R+10]|uniref:hypothetical protein n=1 Tax=Algoriphagus aurantiacus TaxID=3103948 RepID=UPI002B3825A3|nr:hypothetical protein [Algoriphagus sp. D3-2-R+10]MEB2778596.1 hypothetical protein [Algoriphagus sp. D3-2-R+10]